METAEKIFRISNAIPGDVLVLTKPLGTGLAKRIHEWYILEPRRRERMIAVVKDENCLLRSLHLSQDVINTSNDPAMNLLLAKYHLHAVTVVHDAGILGHAERLAAMQSVKGRFTISNFPAISCMHSLSLEFGQDRGCNLVGGRVPELSGGLLIAMEREEAIAYCQELKQVTGHPAWIVGTVDYGYGTAVMSDVLFHVEVSKYGN